MPEGAPSRFDARDVVRVASLHEDGRLEIEFGGPAGKHIVSLPMAAAVDLGCLICDLSDHAPYLVGGARRSHPPRS